MSCRLRKTREGKSASQAVCESRGQRTRVCGRSTGFNEYKRESRGPETKREGKTVVSEESWFIEERKAYESPRVSESVQSGSRPFRERERQQSQYACRVTHAGESLARVAKE